MRHKIQNPEAAAAHFTNGTVDLLIAPGTPTAEWLAKLSRRGLLLGGAPSPGLPRPILPLISIVIPVYGRLDLTLRCLHSLAAHASRLPHEVIVVDDASPEPDRRASWPRFLGLRLGAAAGQPRLHRRHQPRRRGGARPLPGLPQQRHGGHSRLARRAPPDLRGETIRAPGWSAPSSSSPTERCRQAAALLPRRLGRWNWGRGDDPERPEYNFVRDVDYCSGACIMIPADCSAGMNGFDAHYAPAYYEDGDLAFRVRQEGRRVLYQPLARVHHLEGGTSGDRSGARPASSGLEPGQVSPPLAAGAGRLRGAPGGQAERGSGSPAAASGCW